MKTAVLIVLFTSFIFAQSNGVLSSHGGKAYISINTLLNSKTPIF